MISLQQKVKSNTGFWLVVKILQLNILRRLAQRLTARFLNIVVPRLETILDRHLMVAATFVLKINYQSIPPITSPPTAPSTTVPGGRFLVNYGVTDALANVPLNRLISTVQRSINNDTKGLQQSDVFDIL